MTENGRLSPWSVGSGRTTNSAPTGIPSMTALRSVSPAAVTSTRGMATARCGTRLRVWGWPYGARSRIAKDPAPFVGVRRQTGIRVGSATRCPGALFFPKEPVVGPWMLSPAALCESGRVSGSDSAGRSRVCERPTPPRGCVVAAGPPGLIPFPEVLHEHCPFPCCALGLWSALRG